MLTTHDIAARVGPFAGARQNHVKFTCPLCHANNKPVHLNIVNNPMAAMIKKAHIFLNENGVWIPDIITVRHLYPVP